MLHPEIIFFFETDIIDAIGSCQNLIKISQSPWPVGKSNFVGQSAFDDS